MRCCAGIASRSCDRPLATVCHRTSFGLRNLDRQGPLRPSDECLEHFERGNDSITDCDFSSPKEYVLAAPGSKDELITPTRKHVWVLALFLDLFFRVHKKQ